MKPQDLVRPEILALNAYHVADADGMVKLDAMENPYRLPGPLARELAERLAQVDINRYPNPAAPRLRARLKEAMRIPEGCDVVLGNGSDDLIQIVSFTLARPQAVMLTPEPTFVVYKMNSAFARSCSGCPGRCASARSWSCSWRNTMKIRSSGSHLACVV